MFSTFLPRIRHRATSSNNNNTPTWPSVPHNADEDTVSDNIPWPIPEPSYRRRTSNDKNNSSGGSTSSHHHQTPGATIPNWNITISHPIPRTTPNALTGGGGVSGGMSGNRRDERGDATEGGGRGGGDFLLSGRSGRRNPIGVAESNSREWSEGGGREREDEEEEGESQRSKRARRLYPPSPPPLSSVHAPTQTNNQSRNEAIQLARELGPPQVVRIDSGAFDEDEEGEGGEDQDENEGVGEDDDPPSYAYAYTHPGPYDDPGPLQQKQNSSAPLRNAESFIQSPPPAATQPSRSHEVHQLHNGRQSRQSDATSRNQSEAETEFYYSASAEDEFESGDEGRAKSRSSSSSQSGGAGKQQSQGQQPSTHSMTKSRWGLKLQMQLRQLQGNSAEMGADTTIAGSGSAVDNTETGGGQPPSNLETSPAQIAVDTDVHSTKNTYHHHHHSNNYPQLKQLSPIAEQEYVSPRPSPHSIVSLGWKGDPEANEKTGKNRNGGEELAEGDERVRTASGRTVSMGSSVNPAGNAAGTGLGVGGSRTTSGAIDGFTKGPSPFITRHLNRTVSQTSSKSDSVTPHTTTNTPTHSQPTTPRIEGVVPSYVRHIGRGGGGVRGEPTNVNANVQAPPGAIVATTPPVSTAHAASQSPNPGGASTLPKLPSVPTFSAIDLRFSMLGSVSPRDRTSRGRVDKLPVIDGSLEGYREEEEEEEEYERQSLHAESFVTAGEVELEPVGSESGETLHRESVGGGESFIQRRWERNEDLEPGVGGALSSSPRTTTFRAKFESRWPFKTGSSTPTPAIWTFWLGFVFPVLWLVGGWHFTNAGEMPPKCTAWEWYFWNRRWRWSPREWMRECFAKRRRVRESEDSGIRFGEGQRRKGARRSSSVRKGKVYPALPRWVAEKQSTDDGRMRLNDPKRTLRGIQFGYPFIARPPTSQHSYRSGSMSSRPMLARILTAPNRVLDQLYGVQLKEVRGRPESGRRMFDPWIQRCRYAFCYAMLLLAAGLCTASVYLIIVNTRNM